MVKICFKCKEAKSYEDFYRHPQNADGFLSKCKECTKNDVSRNLQKKPNYSREYYQRRKSADWKKKAPNTRTFAEIFYRTWRGSKTGYRTLHLWVQKTRGTPEKCESCCRDGLKGRRIHWANKSGDYLKRKSDWIRLCASCHKRKDMTKNK